MKQNKIIVAYNALNRLSAEPMPVKDACALYKLRKALEPQWEFQREQEMKFVHALNISVRDDGTVEFQKHEDRAEFARRMQELADLDVDVNTERFSLPMEHFQTPISMNELDALAEFIDF